MGFPSDLYTPVPIPILSTYRAHVPTWAFALMGVAVATFLGEAPALLTYLAVMLRYATRLLRQGLFSSSHADMCRLKRPWHTARILLQAAGIM